MGCEISTGMARVPEYGSTKVSKDLRTRGFGELRMDALPVVSGVGNIRIKS